MTIFALVVSTASTVAGLPWWLVAAQVGAAVAYVIAQGFVDLRNVAIDEGIDEAERLLEAIRAGIARGREVVPPATGDTAGLSADLGSVAVARINPEIVLQVLRLAELVIGLFKRRR